ncbi:hypothetical protein J3R30DRAFT_3399592 [Lentinula aciculospora]|uniref:RRM domain-containing protein n=1 Tax=Lentinula aciculospora TaxID=153920 RepID=A0A9W9AUZ6_9AGAR|nr:hypothetical protein J3R30DRAFT_3399592 [Lentinula aciculospora]
MDFRDSKSPSISAASPSPSAPPTNDDIEAVIQMATSSRSSPDGKTGPLKDTRTQLFVGNLPYRVRWQDLKDLFRKAGTVLRADVSLGPDNRSRGHGTVLLATAEDAGRAIDMLNGYSWQTRTLEVRPDRLPPDFDSVNPNPSPFSAVSSPGVFASPQVPGSLLGNFSEIDYNSLFGLDRPSSSSGNACRNLFVGNLPFHCQWQDLKDLFRQAGTIIRADVALGQDGRSRGFGTVVFATDYDAERAVKMFNGYEYNGRVLKVHYDKFSQSTQPMTTPASPTLGALQSSSSSPFQLSGKNRPNQIVMPSGYMLDYGPASAPGTPYDYSYQLQMSIPHPHHTHSHIHQPQPSAHKVEHPTRPPISSEVDHLSNSLLSTRVSDSSSQSGSSSESIKNSTSVATSTSSRTSPSSDHSTSKSAQGQSQTLPKLHPTTSHHSHPHHPGTISIPPAAFSLPVHNMSPMGIPMSPYYSGISPLHHPHAIPMTPHGLPPITPSMPPFTFLPPMPLPSPHAEVPRMSDLGTHPSMSRMSDIVTPTYYPTHTHPHPSGQDAYLNSEDVTDQSSSSSSNTEPNASSQSTSINPYFHPPAPGHRPSFGHPHHLAHHQLTPFSPGLAMSPGAFWGRPGVAGAGPNPYINPAVGAPVHVVQGSPGGFYFHAQPNSGIPRSVAVEIGSRGGAEPGGYFDSVTLGQGYFPPIQSYFGGLGASNVADEILKDQKDKEEDKEQELKAMEEEQSRKYSTIELERVFSGSTSPTSGSGDSLGGTTDAESTFELAARKEGFASRAHSMSTDMLERPQLHRPDSDPPPTTSKGTKPDETSR